MNADAKNVSGQAYSLTVMAPIKEGHSSELASYLDDLPTADESPLRRVASTHFARWVVIDSLVYEGGRQRRDSWRAPRLLFTSNFDGPLDPYLERLRTGLAGVADDVWGHCEGYPGHDRAGAFSAWMRSHQLTSSLFFAAYGDQTVEQVVANLALRQWLIGLAARGQALSDEDLRAAFLTEFPA